MTRRRKSSRRVIGSASRIGFADRTVLDMRNLHDVFKIISQIAEPFIAELKHSPSAQKAVGGLVQKTLQHLMKNIPHPTKKLPYPREAVALMVVFELLFELCDMFILAAAQNRKIEIIDVN